MATFRIEVPDAALDDLAARLERARVPSPRVLGGAEDPETIARIEELVAYWRDEYDWRETERRLNALPHHRAVIDGVGIHYIHVRGTGTDPLPLLLTNGWPSSFVEYLGVLDRLTDPAAYGGDPEDAFTVVLPTLPGYGFSDPCADRPVDRFMIAGLFDRLMTEHLGHRHYVAHGDDIGGGVVNRLGMRHAGSVRAIQTANWFKPQDRSRLTPDEEAYLTADRTWHRELGAYAHVARTRPRTLALGLEDSPLGLAAWILEKFLTWSDPATRGAMSADDLITTVMIYWVTRSFGTSLRLYADGSAPVGPGDVVGVPASVIVPNEPALPEPPDSWLRRGYPALTRVRRLEEGGHFLALESPERFVAEVREAFRPYRTQPTSADVPPVIRSSSS
jgi:pimeloyl-ACP methyl ester carboxylesterase